MNDKVEYHQAVYEKSRIKAFQGNPLIEALPPTRTDEELIRLLELMPKIQDDIEELRPHDRKLAIADLENFTYPLPEYLDFARQVEYSIHKSYSSKNPLLPTANHYLHYLDTDSTPVQPYTGRFDPKPSGITLIGPSGGGKNWMYERVLSLYPEVIEHQEYNQKELSAKQVVYLKVACPPDGSLVTFAANFLIALDKALGIDKYYNEHMKNRPNKGVLMGVVERLARKYWIGVIVIDEFSNMRLPKSASEKNIPTLHKLLLNLMNQSGVPIVFCGNPEMYELVKLTLKNARRAENGGVTWLGKLLPEVWEAVSRRLWRLQVTIPITEWNEKNAKILYEAGKGIIDFMVRGFFESQKLVIGSDDERLTESVLRSGVAKAIELSRDSLNYNAVSLDSDDIVDVSGGEDETPMDTAIVVDNSDNLGTSKASKEELLLDPMRPMHPELFDAVNQLRYKSSLVPRGKTQSILRDSHKQSEIIDFLIKKEIILDDLIDLKIT